MVVAELASLLINPSSDVSLCVHVVVVCTYYVCTFDAARSNVAVCQTVPRGAAAPIRRMSPPPL